MDKLKKKTNNKEDNSREEDCVCVADVNVYVVYNLSHVKTEKKLSVVIIGRSRSYHHQPHPRSYHHQPCPESVVLISSQVLLYAIRQDVS